MEALSLKEENPKSQSMQDDLKLKGLKEEEHELQILEDEEEKLHSTVEELKLSDLEEEPKSLSLKEEGCDGLGSNESVAIPGFNGWVFDPHGFIVMDTQAGMAATSECTTFNGWSTGKQCCVGYEAPFSCYLYGSLQQSRRRVRGKSSVYVAQMGLQ